MKKEKSLSFVVSYEALEKNSLQAPTTDFTLDGGLTSFEQITTDITGKRLSKPPLTILTTQAIDENQLEKLQLYCENEGLKIRIGGHRSLIDNQDWSGYSQLEPIAICYCQDDINQIVEQCIYKEVILQGCESKGICGKVPQFILLNYAIQRLKAIKKTLYGPVGILGYQSITAIGLEHLMINIDWSIDQIDANQTTKKPEGRNSQVLEIIGMNHVGYRVNVASEFKKEWLLSNKKTKDEILAAKNQGIIIENGEEEDYAKQYRIKYKTIGRLTKSYLEAKRINPELSLIDKVLASEYPILQGPMSRVSDNSEFAKRIAIGGGIPTIAAAMMAPSKLDVILEETAEKLKDQTWGVGLLGFLESDFLDKQIQIITKHKPKLCILAGGVPAQALKLEKKYNIKTYIHAPTPELLEVFIQEGARKFILEGRECGGHIGPMSSLSLWERSLNVISKYPIHTQKEIEIIFAGGIYDTNSAKIGTGMARRSLAGSHITFGILIGSAYLCTNEIVETKATTKNYQDVTLKCTKTVYLETAAGHQSRCADTEFSKTFEVTKNKLIEQGAAPKEIAQELDKLILGKLRLASKGKKRVGNQLVSVSIEEQTKEGMYMVGDAVTLIDYLQSIRELHDSLNNGIKYTPECTDMKEYLESKQGIAIVGMSVLLPTGNTIQKLWKSIAYGISSIKTIPASRWDYKAYTDSSKKEHIKSKWGAFCEDVEINLFEYGITPKSTREIEPTQILALEATKWALDDAGYGAETEYDRKRVSVSIGFSGGLGDKGQSYVTRSFLSPNIDKENEQEINKYLDEWGSESFAGLLPNVIAGRIANRFNFGGTNCMSDAACASSLAAIEQGVNKLRLNQSDMCVVGGVDFMMSPFAYFCFSKTGALSPTGEVKSFTKDANGIVLGEGIGIVILKRLKDAEEDGDRIYGLIRGVGSSSDGKEKSMTAPSYVGQTRAFINAYRDAGINPNQIGMYEAHGTGTPLGDQSEANAIKSIINQESEYNSLNCSLGSIKANLGHTKGSAGMIGLIKTTLSLYTKELLHHLPAKNGGSLIQEVAENQGLRVLKSNLPWILNDINNTRKAGVSAFGFGGSNYHIVLEEYIERNTQNIRSRHKQILLKKASLQEDLLGAAPYFLPIKISKKDSHKNIQGNEPIMNSREIYQRIENTSRKKVKVLVGSKTYLTSIQNNLKNNQPESSNKNPQIAALNENIIEYKSDLKTYISCAGQGYQYPGYFAKLAVVNLESLKLIGIICSKLKTESERFKLISYLFNPKCSEEKDRPKIGLQAAQVAYQYSWYHYHVKNGLKIDGLLGHSLGDYTCITIAGLADIKDILELVLQREQLLADQGESEYKMYALNFQEKGQLENSILKQSDLRKICYICNVNSSESLTVAIKEVNTDKLKLLCESAKINIIDLEIRQAFHTTEMEEVGERYKKYIEKIKFKSPAYELSLSTSPDVKLTTENAADLLHKHLTSTVQFTEHIKNKLANVSDINLIDLGPKKGISKLVKHGNNNIDVFNVDGPNFRIENAKVQLTTLLQNNRQPIDTCLFMDEELIDQNNMSSACSAYINGSRSNTALHENEQSFDLHSILNPKHNIKGRKNPLSSNSDGQLVKLTKSSHKTNKKATISDRGKSPRAESAPRKPMNNNMRSPKLQAYIEFQKTIRHLIDSQNRVMSAFLGQPIASEFNIDPSDEQDNQINNHLNSHQAVSHLETIDDERPNEIEQSEKIETNKEKLFEPNTSSLDYMSIEDKLITILSEKTGYETSLLDPNCDLESDLGIDSIKQVEVLGEFFTLFPSLTDESRQHISIKAKELKSIKSIASALHNILTSNDTRPIDKAKQIKTQSIQVEKSEQQANNDDILNLLLTRMSDLSGYPQDLLDIDMDLESELGIDSIKKVEVLGASMTNLALTQDQRELIQSKSRDCKTLRQTANLIADSITASPGKH